MVRCHRARELDLAGVPDAPVNGTSFAPRLEGDSLCRHATATVVHRSVAPEFGVRVLADPLHLRPAGAKHEARKQVLTGKRPPSEGHSALRWLVLIEGALAFKLIATT